MELRVLRYYLTVVETGGINRAAEVLHITQPTLSRQLAQLEEEVGVQLFHRGGRGITLTNEGMLLRRRAEEILSLVDKTAQELVEQEGLIEGRIVIGGGEIAAMQVLVEMMRSFHTRYPRVSYEILTGTAELTKEQMEQGLVDIGVLLEPVDVTQFEFIRMKDKERWVILMPPDDPLAARESITARDLRHKSLILPHRLNVQSELSSWFGRSLKDMDCRFTGNLSTNKSLMVQAGLGYSIAIEGGLPFLDDRRLVYRPLSPELLTSSVIAWKKQQPNSLAVTKFIEFIRGQLNADA